MFHLLPSTFIRAPPSAKALTGDTFKLSDGSTAFTSASF